jgi:hypothetical protein
VYRFEGTDWRTLPCSPHTPRDMPWPLDTILVTFVVEDAFVLLWLLLEGISTPFRTSDLFLVRLAPIPLIRASDGRLIYTYPNLLLSFGY